MTRIVFPWPSSDLSPNARIHYHAKAKQIKLARESAYYTARNASIAPMQHDGEIMVHITFNPPTRRRFDLDGLLSRCKAMLDGLADALEIDDYRFALTLRRGEVVKGGQVVIEIA